MHLSRQERRRVADALREQNPARCNQLYRLGVLPEPKLCRGQGMQRRRLLLIGAAGVSGCVSLQMQASAQSVASLNLVSTAGRQRMLSQRVLKAYAMQALDVLPARAGTILSTSLDELRSGLALVLLAARGPLETSGKQQGELIAKLALSVSVPPAAKTLQAAILVSEELLNNAEALTQGFVKGGVEAPAALLNLAARQRMLSQRAAACFLMYQTEARAPELKQRAEFAATQFKAALMMFDDAKSEFANITPQLELARMQMVFFDSALHNIDNPRKEQFVTVATTSERVLSEMDAMTAEIAKQLALRNGAQPVRKNPAGN
ncbi:MAG: hypothetical protein LH480_08240 [Rubrivivax sp.]|nr:hypothetical protein [Rubrivivax sp.]